MSATREEATLAIARFLADEYCDFEWNKAPERKRDYYKHQAADLLKVSGIEFEEAV
jgi:hypothetical protein